MVHYGFGAMLVFLYPQLKTMQKNLFFYLIWFDLSLKDEIAVYDTKPFI